MTAHGHFHWNEFRTRDVEAAKRFYGDTIGWTFDGMPMPGASGTYRIANQDGQPVAGMVDMAEVGIPAEVPEHWFAFLAVDDVDSRLAKAKGAGASVVMEPSDIPGVGRIAILRQPGGAAVGWMTPAQPA
jgi:predicted enzyme related to lactoylglutathione lyase